jgi:hypothetical protein
VYLLGEPDTRLHAGKVLAHAIADLGNEDGCGPVAAHLIGARHAVPLQAVSSRVLSSFNKARDAVRNHAFARAGDFLIPLIGLGPGLTPSGDDLLAGVAASLNWQARQGTSVGELYRVLTNAVRATAPSRTNLISARLLWHACEGLLYAPAMDLGAALLRGDTDAIPAAVKHLSAIGNTTGVDLAIGLLMGALLGLECDQIAYTGIGEEQPQNNI